MFSPRHLFKTVEEFVDHAAEVIAAKFHSTKTEIEAEFVIIREELQNDLAQIDRGQIELYSLTELLESRLANAEQALAGRGVLQAVPVAAIPLPITPAASQEQITAEIPVA